MDANYFIWAYVFRRSKEKVTPKSSNNINHLIMASDGLQTIAMTGTCRMCQRSRNVEKHLRPVGEVRHGYAVGHIWECKDVDECDMAANDALNTSVSDQRKARIIIAKKNGRLTQYIIKS